MIKAKNSVGSRLDAFPNYHNYVVFLHIETITRHEQKLLLNSQTIPMLLTLGGSDNISKMAFLAKF